MSVERNGEALPGIQAKILDNIETRIRNGSQVPGFVVDSVSRMHPIDVAAGVDGDLRLLGGFDTESIANLESALAWHTINHITSATTVPYGKPIDLLLKPTIEPNLARVVDQFDVIAFLVSQRRGLRENALYTGPLISKELTDGDESCISTPQAARAMLYYRSQSVPNQAVYQSPVVKVAIKDSPTETAESSKLSPEVIICIPVANGQEYDTLPHTLKLLAEQSLDFDKYEIVLLHNTRMTKEWQDKLATDQADDAYRALSEHIVSEQLWLFNMYDKLLLEYPRLRVRAEFEIHDQYAKIGYCRGQLGDNVARKYLERGSTNNPLLLNMDADVRTLNKDYLHNMLITAEQTDAPVITSRIRWRSGNKAEVGPYTEKLMRLSQFVYSAYCAYLNAPNFTDSGMAIRLKEYCLAGGHYWTDEFSETIHIAQRLNSIRRENGEEQTIVVSRGSIFGSHPRRQVDAIARGYTPSMAWDKGVTTFGKVDDQVRTQTTPYQEAEVIAVADLERLIQDTVEHSMGSFDSERFRAKFEVLRRGLAILGLPDCLPLPNEISNG